MKTDLQDKSPVDLFLHPVLLSENILAGAADEIDGITG